MLPTKSLVDVRQPVDNVGYTHTAEGIARVIDRAAALEAEAIASTAARLRLAPDAPFEAAIAPHDDYVYAARVYVHALPHIRARHVILIGVAHKARDFPDTEGRLVFDAFDAWHGPYGDVPISPLRAALLERLDPDDAIVSDALHGVEHSLEALVPFLQHDRRDVEIAPILVPYMSFDRLAELAKRTGRALAETLSASGLVLGRDAAILISSDMVHYGDEDWGGKVFADFGIGEEAYARAVARDQELIARHLAGAPFVDRLRALYGALLQEDFHEYEVSWCGRFSVPFGVALLCDTAQALGEPVPEGELLRYATSLDPGRQDYGVPGLGPTARADLHHFVGFAAMGFRRRM